MDPKLLKSQRKGLDGQDGFNLTRVEIFQYFFKELHVSNVFPLLI